MIDKKLVAWGSSGNIIREIAEYGAEQAKKVGAENVYNFTIGSPSIDPPEIVHETMKKMVEIVPAWKLISYRPVNGKWNFRWFEFEAGESAVEHALLGAPGPLLHHICLHRLHAQRQRRQGVGHQVQPQ